MAAKMDPKRRELYVEGKKDRLFLKWLTLGRISTNSKILDSSFVEIDESQGGEKERLILFAKLAEDKAKNIKFFIDKDFDRFLLRDYPNNLWSTDLNDMEGYLFEESNINKCCLLGCRFDKTDPMIIFNKAIEYAINIGCLRLVSKKFDLKLSINKSKVTKYIKKSGDKIHFNFKSYIVAVIQNSGQRQDLINSISMRLSELKSTLSGIDPIYLVRGKDVILIFSRILALKGVKLTNFEEIFWSSINEKNLQSYKNLSDVVSYLCESV